MRLTEKNGSYKEYIGDGNTITGVREWNNRLTRKLGKLEDIEEELGIDLITLFNEIKGTQAYETISGIVCAVKRKNELMSRAFYND